MRLDKFRSSVAGMIDRTGKNMAEKIWASINSGALDVGSLEGDQERSEAAALVAAMLLDEAAKLYPSATQPHLRGRFTRRIEELRRVIPL